MFWGTMYMVIYTSKYYTVKLLIQALVFFFIKIYKLNNINYKKYFI